MTDAGNKVDIVDTVDTAALFCKINKCDWSSELKGHIIDAKINGVKVPYVVESSAISLSYKIGWGDAGDLATHRDYFTKTECNVKFRLNDSHSKYTRKPHSGFFTQKAVNATTWGHRDLVVSVEPIKIIKNDYQLEPEIEKITMLIYCCHPFNLRLQ